MPGFRSLPDSLSGEAAACVREAALLEQAGDRAGALQRYQAALLESLKQSPDMPGFVCGRLAALYRRLGRYQDEVDLLERYRELQSMEEARTRFDARLSKARALASKHQKSDSGALQSVRVIRETREPRPRRSRPVAEEPQ